MTDALAKISTYFSRLDEELIDKEALLRIVDVLTPLWNGDSRSQNRAICTLAVAAGVFRYYERDEPRPHERLTPDPYSISDARYWSEDYEEHLEAMRRAQ
jgi:hypothetical protein